MLAPRQTASFTGAALTFLAFNYRTIRDSVLDGDVESLSVRFLIVKSAFAFYVMKA